MSERSTSELRPAPIGINVLQAIYWINSSWREVESTTIKRGFERCGFQSVEENGDVSDDDEDDNDYDDIPLSIIARSKELFGLPLLEVAPS